jgi:anion-transporting  ArsA/GET3 family ATPase
VLDSLLSRRLIIVSGKGGVGKTTLSLALALLAAERGRKVIVAEIHSEDQVSHILGRPPIGHHETPLLPGISGINILPRKSFEEYVLLQIRFKALYKAVFENKLVQNFVEATPGLSDMVSIGKVYALTADYDLVIVDAPATGHGLALLADRAAEERRRPDRPASARRLPDPGPAGDAARGDAGDGDDRNEPEPGEAPGPAAGPFLLKPG